MNRVPRIATRILAASSLCLAITAMAQMPAADSIKKENAMTKHATGAFEVKLVPLTLNESVEGEARARMSINKQFHGDLEATSVGEMLSAGTAVKGSAGYVAIERVTGSLHGRKGSFILQHSGTMNRGVPSLSVSVVPDSGTGELAGIAGTLAIIIADGKHSYDFEYTLAANP